MNPTDLKNYELSEREHVDIIYSLAFVSVLAGVGFFQVLLNITSFWGGVVTMVLFAVWICAIVLAVSRTRTEYVLVRKEADG